MGVSQRTSSVVVALSGAAEEFYDHRILIGFPASKSWDMGHLRQRSLRRVRCMVDSAGL